MLTVEEFNAIWDVAWEDPPEEGASEEIKASYKKRMADLRWYVDQWLPRCVDERWYGSGHRPYERLTNLIQVEGELRERVSATREGYGFIQFENSRESWLAKFAWDEEQEKEVKGTGRKAKPAPNYSHKNKAATKQFKSKWSDYAAGQTSKWDPVVYSELQLKINKVEKWREADKKKGYVGQDLAKKLSGERQGIPIDQEQPGGTNKKKRARSAKDDDDDEDYTPVEEPESYPYRRH